MLHIIDLSSILLHIPDYKNIFEDIFSAIFYQISPKSVTRVTLLNVRLIVAFLSIFLLFFSYNAGFQEGPSLALTPFFMHIKWP